MRGGSLRIALAKGGADGCAGGGAEDTVPDERAPDENAETEGTVPDLVMASAATCGDTDFTGGFSDGLAPLSGRLFFADSSPMLTHKDSPDLEMTSRPQSAPCAGFAPVASSAQT
jgi:hypothetical protein